MISIIICTYNREKYIGQLLNSLAQNDYPVTDYEIILVDNNCTDNTHAKCEQFAKDYPNVKFFYFIEKNPGLSHARNRGIKEAHGDWFVFIDDDAMVQKTYLKNLDFHLKEHTDAGAFGGTIEPFFEGERPTWLSKWSMGFISAINMGEKVKLFTKEKYPIGANMGISRKTIEKIGLFNSLLGRTEKLLLGGEEKDIFMRISKENIPIYYFPQIDVKHCIPPSRTTTEHIKKLGYGVGVSERLRTTAIGKAQYVKRLVSEIIKWGGTLTLWGMFALMFSLPKGNILVIFRYNVSKGLLKK